MNTKEPLNLFCVFDLGPPEPLGPCSRRLLALCEPPPSAHLPGLRSGRVAGPTRLRVARFEPEGYGVDGVRKTEPRRVEQWFHVAQDPDKWRNAAIYNI